MSKRLISIFVLLAAGCGPMSGLNRDGLGIVRDQTIKTQGHVVSALRATKDLVSELNEAAAEEREPDLVTPITNIVEALNEATKSVDEAGKTVVILQEGIGQPKSAPPQTAEEIEAWRDRYMVLLKILNKAQDWLASKVPGVPSSIDKGSPAPWSSTEVGGLITVITGLLGGGGILGKKQLAKRKEKKQKEQELEEEKEEAQQLIAELRSELDEKKFAKIMAEKKRLKSTLEQREHEKRLSEV